MKTINIYTFDELTEDVKQSVIENYRNNNFEFFWSDEWVESLKKSLKAFDITLKNYSIDFACSAHSNVSFQSEDIHELKGIRLRKYLLNNYEHIFYSFKPYGKYPYKRRSKIFKIENSCPFTGYCGDESFLQPFRQFLKKPDNRTFSDLITEAIETVLQDIENDYDYQNSDEYIAEHLTCNNYEYTESGIEL